MNGISPTDFRIAILTFGECLLCKFQQSIYQICLLRIAHGEEHRQLSSSRVGRVLRHNPEGVYCMLVGHPKKPPFTSFHFTPLMQSGSLPKRKVLRALVMAASSFRASPRNPRIVSPRALASFSNAQQTTSFLVGIDITGCMKA